MIYLTALLLSFFITVALIPVFSKLAFRFNVGLDLPNSRKIHAQPIPRVGGLAVAVGVFGSTVLWMAPSDFPVAYAVGTAFIVLAGLIDDLKGLDFRFKFLAQTVAALVMVTYGGIRITNLGALLPDGMSLPETVAIPLTVVAIVGVTNAVNLADGLDGLAGGICLLSFACLGYLAYLGENMMLGVLAVALAGSVLGFLRYNTYPAELFLGDTGSQFLGFSAVIVSLAITQETTPFSPLLPLLILGFPVLDTLTVMAQRLAEKRPIFAPDKKHFHHRLMSLGLYHTESVLVIYALQAVLVVGAYVLRFHSEWLLLTGYVTMSVAILIGFHAADAAHWRARRYHVFDHLIKGRLKIWRERGLFIEVSYRALQFGVPLLLLVTCLFLSEIPWNLGLIAAGCLFVLGIAWRFGKRWMRGSLMLVLYLFVPYVVFLSEQRQRFVVEPVLWAYNLSFVALGIFAVLTLKLTRRKRGFKTTPTDFLILFIALVFPYFVGAYVPIGHLPIIVARTIMFFFCYEVLVGESRSRYSGLALVSIPSLGVIAFRGLMGW